MVTAYLELPSLFRIIAAAASHRNNIAVESVKSQMEEGNYANAFLKVGYDFPVECDVLNGGYAPYPFSGWR